MKKLLALALLSGCTVVEPAKAPDEDARWMYTTERYKDAPAPPPPVELPPRRNPEWDRRVAECAEHKDDPKGLMEKLLWARETQLQWLKEHCVHQPSKITTIRSDGSRWSRPDPNQWMNCDGHVTTSLQSETEIATDVELTRTQSWLDRCCARTPGIGEQCTYERR